VGGAGGGGLLGRKSKPISKLTVSDLLTEVRKMAAAKKTGMYPSYTFPELVSLRDLLLGGIRAPGGHKDACAETMLWNAREQMSAFDVNGHRLVSIGYKIIEQLHTNALRDKETARRETKDTNTLPDEEPIEYKSLFARADAAVARVYAARAAVDKATVAMAQAQAVVDKANAKAAATTTTKAKIKAAVDKAKAAALLVAMADGADSTPPRTPVTSPSPTSAQRRRSRAGTLRSASFEDGGVNDNDNDNDN
jgi:hypothetical protein